MVSPILSNIFLHYVLDLWFEQDVKPRMRRRAFLIRYADDFVIGFEDQHDAERVFAVVPKRFGRFGLTVHPTKTNLCRSARRPFGRRVLTDHKTINLERSTCWDSPITGLDLNEVTGL